MYKTLTTILFYLLAFGIVHADVEMPDDVDFNDYNANAINTAGITTANIQTLAAPQVNGASSTVSDSYDVAGGIYNGDFSLGDVAEASAINAEFGNSGWWLFNYAYGSNGTCEITNGVLKMSSTTATSGASFIAYANSKDANLALQNHVPVKPSSTYKLSYRYKTEGITTTYSRGFVRHYKLYDSTQTAITTNDSSYVSGTNDWTSVSTTINTTASAAFFSVYFALSQEAGTVYIDDVKLEQVESFTSASEAQSLGHAVITGVSSEFVDQSQTAFDGEAFIGNVAGVQYWRRQTYTPEQSMLTSIALRKLSTTGTPTGNLIIEARSPADAVIASVDIENAVYSAYAGGTFTVPIFALQDTGVAGHSIILYSDNSSESINSYFRVSLQSGNPYADGAQSYSTNEGSSWTEETTDLYFKTHYAENTNDITLTNSTTDTATTMSFGDVGLPEGAVVDWYNGTMTWDSGLLNYENSAKLFTNFIYEASNGGQTTPLPLLINGWLSSISRLSTNYLSAGTKYLYLRVGGENYSSVSLTTTYYLGNANYKCSLEYSYDGVTFAPLETNVTGSAEYKVYTNNFSNDHRDVYLRYSTPGSGFLISLRRIQISADIDTSTISPLRVDPGANTINAAVNGGSYKADVTINEVSGGIQTQVMELQKQTGILNNGLASLNVLRNPSTGDVEFRINDDGDGFLNGTLWAGGMTGDATASYDVVSNYGMIAPAFDVRSTADFKTDIKEIAKESSVLDRYKSAKFKKWKFNPDKFAGDPYTIKNVTSEIVLDVTTTETITRTKLVPVEPIDTTTTKILDGKTVELEKAIYVEPQDPEDIVYEEIEEKINIIRGPGTYIESTPVIEWKTPETEQFFNQEHTSIIIDATSIVNGETPKEWLSPDGNAVSLYSVSMDNAQAVQALLARIEELQAEIEALKANTVGIK